MILPAEGLENLPLDAWRNHFICGDALAVLRHLPDACVDLVITSPPYNLRNSTGNGLKHPGHQKRWANPALAQGYDTGYTDDLPHDAYVAWQRSILAELWRVIKPTGAIYYNHKWRVQGGELQRLAETIVAGYPVRQILIWQRAGGINFNDHYFVPTYEVIYLIAKPGYRLRAGANCYGDVWRIPQDHANPHPAPFPLEIPERIIRASAQTDLVLDPFSGSGTTALAAVRCGKAFIGIDRSARYCAWAARRVQGRPWGDHEAGGHEQISVFDL
ncbi:MAG: site-specific DNA-methyltransferase [Sulfobacillus acidophilus]|uniref:Methyltransferase n=1 Tax=Sulfobacillus acidophilus TaxID=53633 RepID=A0A2T2WCS9_9FIRM|nr:MAG: site-specific DNA-methyltransferase [Sulfobacillus acidophilus]